MRAVIAKHHTAPFEWGVSDCSLFADVVLAVTGFDPIAALRGYTSELGAMKNLRACGYATTAALIETLFDEIDPNEAQRGDLGYPADIRHPLMSPAVIDGATVFSKAPDGPVIMPRSVIVRAFAV